MIDVFIRANYTLDSNAMLVGFLREFSDAEEAVGNITGSVLLRNKADLMSSAVQKYLWRDDHYITQLNPDMITTRDFVDYDGNLIALAHNITKDINQFKSVLKRIDSGKCSGAQNGGPQFVSEIYYGPKDTTGGNVGDSWCSMGRIALVSF